MLQWGSSLWLTYIITLPGGCTCVCGCVCCGAAMTITVAECITPPNSMWEEWNLKYSVFISSFFNSFLQIWKPWREWLGTVCVCVYVWFSRVDLQLTPGGRCGCVAGSLRRCWGPFHSSSTSTWTSPSWSSERDKTTTCQKMADLDNL